MKDSEFRDWLLKLILVFIICGVVVVAWAFSL